MGGKKKYIEMFGSFMEQFKCAISASNTVNGHRGRKNWPTEGPSLSAGGT